ncbi:aminodeoxychorismate/anthranilate synthase component II [Pelagicoccus sp. SDUM812003]|nr:aminodeoxychorismate/anthranilate synthase component II [Pelagicoccus sp. SDUM812003]
MILLVDNYDSFTYNLFQYIRALGERVEVVRNDAVSVDSARALRPDLIVLSPGPGGPESTGSCLQIIEAFHQQVPILGVCLGMQTIACFFGARIVKAGEPMHGKTRLVHHDGAGLFQGLKNPLRVTRYHSLIVQEASLPDCLKVSARSEEGEIMGLSHHTYPVFGVQFHPEAYLTEQGMELLGNALGRRAC